MHQQLTRGLPATVSGPYGMFDYTLGGPRQIWVAGGVGIAPFLSWLRSVGPISCQRIDLFYTARSKDDAVYTDELRSRAQRLSFLYLHLVLTDHEPRLTGERLLAAADFPPNTTHVFMCGPQPLVTDMTRDLRRRGFTRDYLHAEHFAFR